MWINVCVFTVLLLRHMVYGWGQAGEQIPIPPFLLELKF